MATTAVATETSNTESEKRRSLLYDFNLLHDALCSLLIAVGAALSSAGGIGGGGLFVPVLTLVGNFPSAEAIPLSTITILGAAIANFAYNLCRHHPNHKHIPIIDYDISLVFVPMTLLGTLIGVFGNVMLPSWMLALLLLILLGFTGVRTILTGIRKFREEHAAQNHSQTKDIIEMEELHNNKLGSSSPAVDGSGSLVQEVSPAVEVSPVVEESPAVEVEGSSAVEGSRPENGIASNTENGHLAIAEITNTNIASSEHGTGTNNSPQHNAIFIDPTEMEDYHLEPGVVETSLWKDQCSSATSHLDDNNAVNVAQTLQKQQFTQPSSKLLRTTDLIMPGISALLFTLCLTTLTVFSLLKGGRRAPSIINTVPCSWLYWIFVFANFPVFILTTMLAILIVVLRYRLRIRAKFSFKAGDVKWAPKQVFFYPLICIFAGVIASLLGLGGGIVQGPILLAMKVHPQVAAATTAYMLLFTAISTAAQFFIIGALPWDFALWYAVIGFISAGVGQLVVGVLIRRYRKASILILLVGAIILISAFLLCISGTLNIINQIRNKEYMGFNSPCSA